MILLIFILTIMGTIIVLSLQEEDEPSIRDVIPPVLIVLAPDPMSIYAPGENFTLEVDTGENLENVPSVSGVISDEEYKTDLLEMEFVHSSGSIWIANITLPIETELGDWYIFIQAWDRAGNEGHVKLQIKVEE